MADIACSRNTSFGFFMIMFIFFVIAFGAPFWYVEVIYGGKESYGLWQVRVDRFNGLQCDKIGANVDTNFLMTQVMMCKALIFNFISFVCYCVWMCKDKSYLRSAGAGPVGKTALSMCQIGALDNIFAVMMFGIWHMEVMQGLSWSFALAVISGSVNFLNSVATLGVTACCFKPENAEPRGTVHPSGYPVNPVTQQQFV